MEYSQKLAIARKGERTLMIYAPNVEQTRVFRAKVGQERADLKGIINIPSNRLTCWGWR